MSYNVGDRVLVNGGVVATILAYDEDANIVVWEHKPHGGGADRVTSHISNTRLEPVADKTAVEVDAAIPAFASTRNAVTNDSEIAANGVSENDVDASGNIA